MKASAIRTSKQSGIALLTTVLLLLLMSSMLVGFVVLVNSSQKLNGANNDYGRAFYGAEAGMEKLTADLGTLFDANYSPSGAQVQALITTPPSLSGISYLKGDGSNGYNLDYPNSPGTPTATVATIKSGPYQGMTALATPYTLTVTARTTNGAEVKLRRTTQTVGIPMFQFGVFSDPDLSFHAGPNFNFGGRVHTNGNVFLAEGDGATLTMSDRVTAVKDVVRKYMANGWPTSSNYNGTVQIATSPSTTACPTCRAMAMTEGSIPVMPGPVTLGPPCTGGPQGFNATCGGYTPTTSPTAWSTISLGTYGGNVLNGATGAKTLNLGIVTVGSGSTQAIDIIRRPISGEASNVLAERYFAQANLRVLLSDNPTDIMSLTPCIDSGVQPFNLEDIAKPVSSWTSANAVALKAKLIANGVTPLPLAASGAAGAAYLPANGYWQPNGNAVIKGFIKIEAQLLATSGGIPCGAWRDVTIEVLGLGYVGKNINPTPQSLDNSTLNPDWTGTNAAMELGNSPALPNLPATEMGPQYTAASRAAGVYSADSTDAAPLNACPEPHPNAVIRLERIRDNPSSVAFTAGLRKTTAPTNLPVQSTVTQVCAVDPTTGAIPDPFGALKPGWYVAGTDHLLPTDFWPNVLYDTREGQFRDTVLAGNIGGITYSKMAAMNGLMQYIEVDARNVTRWLRGTIGTNGPNTKDGSVAPNDFVMYLSDRRGNYTAAPLPGVWPPASPSLKETGEYGFSDFINNNTDPTNACPSGTLDSGENLNGTGNFYTYGQDATHAIAAVNVASPWLGGNGIVTGLTGTAATNAIAPNPNCVVTAFTGVWPGSQVIHANEGRENPPYFFRRAVKIVNGSDLSAMGSCPGGVACGLSIAMENPLYLQGDYNCPSGCAGTTWNDPHVAASLLADAVTLLSNKWNDVNSFIYPVPPPAAGNPVTSPSWGSGTARNAIETHYRTAIVAGKGIAFPFFGGSADNGSDGGVHNFLRYLEDWGGQTLYYRGSIISMYFNRQGIGIFKCCATVYNPATRGYNFDVEFLQPNLLPPRTPLFRDVNTTGFTQLLLPNQ